MAPFSSCFNLELNLDFRPDTGALAAPLEFSLSGIRLSRGKSREIITIISGGELPGAGVVKKGGKGGKKRRGKGNKNSFCASKSGADGRRGRKGCGVLGIAGKVP